jgi:hypothetical protein
VYKGLENKIIDLQQKLTESKSMNKELKKSMVGHENLVKEMENLKIAEVKENVFYHFIFHKIIILIFLKIGPDPLTLVWGILAGFLVTHEKTMLSLVRF